MKVGACPAPRACQRKQRRSPPLIATTARRSRGTNPPSYLFRPAGMEARYFVDDLETAPRSHSKAHRLERRGSALVSIAREYTPADGARGFIRRQAPSRRASTTVGRRRRGIGASHVPSTVRSSRAVAYRRRLRMFRRHWIVTSGRSGAIVGRFDGARCIAERTQSTRPAKQPRCKGKSSGESRTFFKRGRRARLAFGAATLCRRRGRRDNGIRLADPWPPRRRTPDTVMPYLPRSARGDSHPPRPPAVRRDDFLIDRTFACPHVPCRTTRGPVLPDKVGAASDGGGRTRIRIPRRCPSATASSIRRTASSRWGMGGYNENTCATRRRATAFTGRPALDRARTSSSPRIAIPGRHGRF